MQTPPCTPAETELLRNLKEELSPDTSWQCSPHIKNVTDKDFVTWEEETKKRQNKKKHFHVF